MPNPGLVRVIIIEILAGCVVIWYIAFIVLFFKRRESKVIRSCSPKLLFAATLANFLSTCLLLSTIIACLCPNSEEDVLSTAKHRGIALSECTFAPIMFLGYIFRLMQINKILTVSLEKVKSPVTSSIWFKQGIYILILCLLSLLFLAYGIFIACILISSKKKNSYHKYYEDLQYLSTMIIDFLCVFSFAICGLQKHSSEFFFTEVKVETAIFLVTWTLCNGLYNFTIFSLEEKLDKEVRSLSLVLLILVLRNIATFIISFVIPILKDGGKEVFIETEDEDLTEKVEGVLLGNLSCSYFSEFLESLASIEGKNAYRLYIKIKEYEDEIDKDTMKAQRIARRILYKYLKNNNLKIDEITDKVRVNIEQDIDKLDKNLFITLFGIVINKLDEYFALFIQSELYKCLRWDLENRKIILLRVNNAGLA
jgi:hypothetical protein